MSYESREDDRLLRTYWRVGALVQRFVADVLRLEWGLVSIHSRISDFERVVPHDDMIRRMREVFHIDVESLSTNRVIDVLAIVDGRGLPRRAASLDEAILTELEYRKLLPEDGAQLEQLLKEVRTAWKRSETVRDLEYRLPNLLPLRLQQGGTAPFQHWDWLAEDLFEATRHLR